MSLELEKIPTNAILKTHRGILKFPTVKIDPISMKASGETLLSQSTRHLGHRALNLGQATNRCQAPTIPIMLLMTSPVEARSFASEYPKS
jgi:hypothetical protein